ncbi:hypothetical protein BH09PSE2_BH09PSE2_15710 [soil metagenome]
MGSFEELDTDEPLHKRMERHAYDRLIMLSDGVFAIAATLMALEVKIPEHWDGTLNTLITTASVSAVVSYLISFMVVAIYWMGNRRVLAMFRRVDGPSSFIALIVLMLVALLPPVSRTLVTDTGRLSESSVIYVSYVTLIGFVQAGLWGYGCFAAGLADKSLTTSFKIRTLIWMLVVPTAASAMAMLAMGVLPGPTGYAGVFVVMTLMFVLRARVLKR